MKTYQIHSSILSSEIQLTYNASGILTRFEVMGAEVTKVTESKMWLMLTEPLFLEVCSKFKIHPIEIGQEVTFDMFFERYGYKVDKAVALKAWNKLTKDEQIKAYNYIPIYLAQLKRSGTAQKYPSTYLNQKNYL